MNRHRSSPGVGSVEETTFEHCIVVVAVRLDVPRIQIGTYHSRSRLPIASLLEMVVYPTDQTNLSKGIGIKKVSGHQLKPLPQRKVRTVFKD